MNTPTKLGAYVLGLAVLSAASFGVGKLVGPEPRESRVASDPANAAADHAAGGDHAAGDDNDDNTDKADAGHNEHSAGGQTGSNETTAKSDASEAEPPGGLQVATGEYRLVPRTTTLEAADRMDFRFQILGPDGEPVTRFETVHEKKVHFIVVRRDLSGFQHLHPKHIGDGVWSVELTLPEPGTYRIFTDIQPSDAKESLTLGADVFVPGDFRPAEPRPESDSGTVDDYTVRIDGELEPGETSTVTLTVERNGKPVDDLQPYLGAFGHLVALRDGDLAYLHVHPRDQEMSGPTITFDITVPSAGAYGLYLDFKHEGDVRTVEFSKEAR